MVKEQDQRISEAVEREHGRLLSFIRRRVPDPEEAEDVLQDVFYELVQAYRMMKPVEQVTAWLFRVARNRITDRFRRRSREALRTGPITDSENGDEALGLEEVLPSLESGPEDSYARHVLLEELDEALEELPEPQREAFVAHELLGQSFKQIAAETGVSVNTLLSRKRYAVLHLRRRLQAIYDEFIEG